VHYDPIASFASAAGFAASVVTDRSWFDRHALHTRGRILRSFVLPLAKQL
jgi:hypothetical protein